MSLVELAQDCHHLPIELIKSKLSEIKADFAYGSTYSLEEAHRYIQQGFPIIARVLNKSVLFRGEDDGVMVADIEGTPYSVPDDMLRKAWTGEMVVLTGEPEKEKEQPADFFIFASERNSWGPENAVARDHVIRMLTKTQIPTFKLPAHPVVVVFRKPTEKEEKDGIRSVASSGAEITLLDHTDPVSEVLHELGHFYWITRLTDDERKGFEAQREQFHKNGGNPVLVDVQHNWKNGEELFCTLYMWRMKEYLVNAGYGRILEVQYPEGYQSISKVWDRVREETELSLDWARHERSIGRYVKHLCGRPMTARINGHILKAKAPAKPPEVARLPSFVPVVELGAFRERRWVRVEDGHLSGETLVLKADSRDIDYDYMKKKGKRSYLIPRQVEVKGKNGRYRTTTYTRPVDSDSGAVLKMHRPGFIERLRSIFS